MPHWLYRLRYGHAFPSKSSSEDPVDAVRRLVLLDQPIRPRAPSDAAVNEAEIALGLANQPVYAYIGDLHSDLGRVGLIVSDQWYRRKPLGVSRCDSGGLIGLRGGFAFLGDKDLAKETLIRLTLTKSHWERLFRLEVFRSHGRLDGWPSYLRAQPPCRTLNDVRDQFIASIGMGADRRLWTWEVRSDAPIAKADVLAMAITSGMSKPVLDDRRANPGAFGNIKLIVGVDTPGGIHHFDEERVIQAFMGRP